MQLLRLEVAVDLGDGNAGMPQELLDLVEDVVPFLVEEAMPTLGLS
jgi:hypothetical protein